jgi:uncharacterized protein (TIGR02117 family)
MADGSPPVVIYVVKRHWHTDIGFGVTDISSPLATVVAKLPAARILLFGFGDRHYLMNQDHGLSGSLVALWPGPGVVLVTGLTATPEQAFGGDEVKRLALSADQARRLEDFVWKTLVPPDGVAGFLGKGPYDGSVFYSATAKYSGLNTCNTWTAEALKVAGLPVSSSGVEFSGQVWRQVGEIQRQQAAASALQAPAVRSPSDAQ